MKARSPVRIAILLLLGTPAILPAQMGYGELPPGKWWKNRRVIQSMKLTAEQQEKIESLWAERRKTFIDQKAQLDKAHLDLTGLLATGTVEETQALVAFERVQAAKTSIERLAFLMRIQIKNVLTSAQQAQLEEIAQRLRKERPQNRNTTSRTARPEQKSAPAPPQ